MEKKDDDFKGQNLDDLLENMKLDESYQIQYSKILEAVLSDNKNSLSNLKALYLSLKNYNNKIDAYKVELTDLEKKELISKYQEPVLDDDFIKNNLA
jgi:hypothetical protein